MTELVLLLCRLKKVIYLSMWSNDCWAWFAKKIIPRATGGARIQGLLAKHERNSL